MTPNQVIPTYPLAVLTQPDGPALDVLLVDQPIEAPDIPLNRPYRTDYYGVGICFGGQAELRANLETCSIAAGWLLTMSPRVIKQWRHRSADFHTLTVFFTAEFMQADMTGENLREFSFFDTAAQYALPLAAEQFEELAATLRFLQRKHQHFGTAGRDNIRRLVYVLLREVAAIYAQQQTLAQVGQTRGQWLAAEFKKLVNEHFVAERSLPYYAGKLGVTPNHLTETVKAITGQTAGDWLAEALVLEAKVLLHNPALSIAQVADALRFSDQSAFGKFFKKAAGVSPSTYRQSA